MTKQITQTNQISLPSDVLVKARGRARSLGMSLEEYMQSLIDKDVDVASKEHDPWLPVPPEVKERLNREYAEFREENKKSPRPSAKTGDELIKLLDEEAALLPDDDDEEN